MPGSFEEFSDRTGFLSMKFKSVLDPVFKFIKVKEFDMPHSYYVKTLRQLTGHRDIDDDEETKE